MKRIFNKKVLFGILIFLSNFLIAIQIGNSATPINSCSKIIQPGEYYLNNNISASSTCIEISANNVVLDCRGYYIKGQQISNTYGISISRFSATDTNITIKNCIITSWYYGIYLVYAKNNTITNSTFSSNLYGIYFLSSSNNTIHSNIIQNSNNYGIDLYSSGSNLIYNNLFNNSNNFKLEKTIYFNYWNTTIQEGKRIYSIGKIGGNYWTNPSGNGFSDTCNDTNGDGFCDNPLIIDPDQTGNNTDYLPLSKNYTRMEVNLYQPPSYFEIIRGRTFWINASINYGGYKAYIYSRPRYNLTSSSPNFPISSSQGSIPFYVVKSQMNPSNWSFTKNCFQWDEELDDDDIPFLEIADIANFTYSLPSSPSSLYLNLTVRIVGISEVYEGYVKIFNFSSNSWYNWLYNVDYGNYTIRITPFSGLIKNGVIIIQFYASDSVIDVYNSFITFSSNTFVCELEDKETCNVSWPINATGNYYSTWAVDAYFWDGGRYNFTQNSVIKIIPGIMIAQLSSPSSTIVHNITKYTSFTIRGIVNCMEGNCGDVIGILKYNRTSKFPDTPIGSSSEDKPFYIISNSSFCSSMKEGDICSMVWIINATGEKYTEWKIGISIVSSLIKDELTTENVSIRILPICSQLPLVKNEKLRLIVECEGNYYSFAKTRQEFNLEYPLKVEFKIYNASSTLKNFMIGFGSGDLDNYGIPEKFFVFKFNETHIKFLKHISSSIEELGSKNYYLPFSNNLSIEINSSTIVFIVGNEKFEFPFYSSINLWYFFANAYNSKDTIVDIDDVIVRKYILPEPQVYFGNEEYFKVKRVGLASEKGKQNLVSLEKIYRFNQICAERGYESLKTNFGLDAEFSITIRRINDSISLLTCGYPLIGKPFALIERIFAVDDGSYAKLELRVWK